jgi:DNA-binding CsgD family transcriptional regulator
MKFVYNKCMLKHLEFLYYFISLLSGVAVLSLLIFYVLKTKNRILISYLLFFCCFSIKICSWILDTYCYNLGLNIPVWLYYPLSQISVYLLLFTLPLFFHSLFNVPFRKWANIIFFILVALFPVKDIVGFLSKDFAFSDEADALIFGIVLLSVIVYCLIIGFFFYSKLKPKILKKIIRLFLILTILFMPGFIFDSVFIVNNKILFSALFFLIWNCITLYYAFKYFLLSKEKLALTQDYIKEFDLTKREAEILGDLLQGLSYKEIGNKKFVSLATVKTHLHNIYTKTGAKSRHDLTVIINQYQKSEN